MTELQFDPDDYRVLNLQGSIFDTLQQTRIMLSNRLTNPRVKDLADAYGLTIHLDAIKAAETEAGKILRQLYIAAVPEEILVWQSQSPGVGELLTARLLGRTGHPRMAFPKRWVDGTKGAKLELIDDEPYTRSLRQFWAFCGLGDPLRKRVRNMTQAEALALGDPNAKKIMWNIATSVMRNSGARREQPRTSYRVVYDAARIHYDERLHATPCVRCGPSGKPAQEGSQWNDGHKHAAALRKMQKEILRDLWIKACISIPVTEEEAQRWRDKRHDLIEQPEQLKTMTAGAAKE